MGEPSGISSGLSIIHDAGNRRRLFKECHLEVGTAGLDHSPVLPQGLQSKA
jgi:hypothetical protein